MKETMLMTHPGKYHPPTNILNESNYPIDSIWFSLGLIVLRAG